MTIKEQCEQFLRYKYEYYILNQPTVSDLYFDKFEDELRKTNDKLALEVVDLTDFPSLELIESLGLNVDKIAPEQKIRRDETKYKHWTKMLSIKKLQVNDESNIPYNEIDNFLNKRKSDFYEASCKYDGNSMDLMYEDGVLYKALTRGEDGLHGLDRTMKMKLIVPNKIPMMGKVEIRGEVVISRKIWRNKYFDPNKISNERNFVGGALSKEDFNFREINDLVFVAYSLVKIEPLEYVENTMKVLKDMGFNKNHEPFLRYIKSSADFENMYFDFKKYRETCEFLLDGIVLKFPENLRIKMVSHTKYPAWSLAIKFESQFAETVLLYYEWNQGKTSEFCPVAILKEIELGGTMNKRASCHNLSFVINNGAFPGCIVRIRKAGEIINQVVEVVKKSPNHDEYMKQFEEFMKK
ncbi:hypothetical protein M0Q97_08500 [Candidatus Dojkabacteria bacterium]|jgi:DNA ligase (NAD+)|nr:hypothetical protein [Candidatus Dojkabacteria bacterium]